MLSKEDYKIFNAIENKEVFISIIEYLNDSQKEELKELIDELEVVKTSIIEEFEDTWLCYSNNIIENCDEDFNEANNDNFGDINSNEIEAIRDDEIVHYDDYDDYDDSVE